jgi:tripartite-type tricarboxylate transporter receptor subunit TctC
VTGQPLADGGQVRALGLIGLKRASALPQVPTLAESGVKGLESSSWYGVFAPAKTPPAIVDRLAREIAKAVQSPDVAERMRARGDEPVGGTPEAFSALVSADVARFTRIVEVAGIPKQ